MTEEVAAAAPAAESGVAEEAEPAVAESEPVEAVEIPKQQSAEVAADSEAGEGART
ncbi:gliding motility protein [Streptomyces erythrochromogenes]|uniref:gliding motility protein n=1 Tax=Streptomyces erythrochromogenes TaxID=285574 RepID=UPI0002EEA0D0